MIDALFNDPNYMAEKKMLDAISLRQQAIASNIANLETPGYKRVDLSPSFTKALQQACAADNPQEIAQLNPTLAPDPNAKPNSRDGNTVNLESEMMALNKNVLAHQVETRFLDNTYYRLKMAITGKA